MTEKDREIIIKRIEEDKKIPQVISKMEKRVEELKNTKEVMEYFQLLEKIAKLSSYLKLAENNSVTEEQKVNEMIKFEFRWGRDYTKKVTPCNHDIWIYFGSYRPGYNLWNEHEYDYEIYDESDKDFMFNKYICLECGECIQEKNYQEFESTHFVLKNRDNLNYEHYQNLYYQSLYTHPVKEAQQIVIDEFNKNKELIKKKVKKK